MQKPSSESLDEARALYWGDLMFEESKPGVTILRIASALETLKIKNKVFVKT